MAVPSNPSNLANGAVLTETWVDDVRALLVFFRDDRPLFKGQSQTNNLSDGSFTEIRWADGAGGFVQTPLINVGGFDVPAVAGYKYGVQVPEAGVYRITPRIEFTADATVGRRGVRVYVNGSQLDGSECFVGAAATASNVSHVMTDVLTGLLGANDEIGIEAFQDSGNTLTSEDSWLTIQWVGSSVS